MAFTKQPKLCQDAPAGVETFNRLNDNLDSFVTDFTVAHVPLENEEAAGAGVGLIDGSTVDAAGTHDHPLIPRGAAIVRQVTSDPTLIETYGVQLISGFGCLATMDVLDVGHYFFPINGFVKVWGKGTIHPEAVSPILAGIAQRITVQPGIQSGTGATGLVVRTLRVQENDSGEDELLPFHTGFGLIAFGRRTVAPGSVGLAPPRRSRFAAGPRGGPVRFPRPPRR